MFLQSLLSSQSLKMIQKGKKTNTKGPTRIYLLYSKKVHCNREQAKRMKINAYFLKASHFYPVSYHFTQHILKRSSSVLYHSFPTHYIPSKCACTQAVDRKFSGRFLVLNSFQCICICIAFIVTNPQKLNRTHLFASEKYEARLTFYYNRNDSKDMYREIYKNRTAKFEGRIQRNSDETYIQRRKPKKNNSNTL